MGLSVTPMGGSMSDNIRKDGRQQKEATMADEQKPPLSVCMRVQLDTTRLAVLELGSPMTFVQMFGALLKLPEEATIEEITTLLKERKHTLTTLQIDLMVEKQEGFLKNREGGEDFGLRTDGYANFFLVENADGTVSVVGAGRYGGRWRRGVVSLGRDRVWDREGRLVVSNSAALNL